MLEKNIGKRLCKMTKIKQHPWLNNFSWDTLYSMEMQPPQLPRIKQKDDNYERVPFLTYLKVLLNL